MKIGDSLLWEATVLYCNVNFHIHTYTKKKMILYASIFYLYFKLHFPLLFEFTIFVQKFKYYNSCMLV